MSAPLAKGGLLLAVFLLLLPLVACEREAPPELVTLTDLLPREVEQGDRLELSGNGFPEGRVAEVRFRGALRRPGEAPEENAEVRAEGEVTGARAIEVRYDEGLEARFCGAGDHLVHTTFTGDVEAAFPAAAPGAPPVTATLHGVHLDLRPPRTASADDQREGERALAFLGLHVEPRPSPGGGLVVASVDASSRAEEAGLHAGDVLSTFDGLVLDSVGDAIAPPRASHVVLGVHRSTGLEDEPHTVSFEGFRPAAAEGLLPAAALLVFVSALVLIFALPPGPRRAWLERRLSGEGARVPFAALLPAAPRARRVYFAIIGLVAAAAASLPIASFRALSQIDLGTVGGGAATTLAAVAFLTAGGQPRRGFFGRIIATIVALLFDLLVALGMAAAVVASGSLKLRDLVRAQGGAPWSWNAFHTPALFLAALLCVVSLAAQRPTESDGGLAEADRGPSLPRAITSTFAATEWAHLAVGSVLVAVVFFGGFGVPGLTSRAIDASLTAEIAAALVLLVKAAVVGWAVMKLRAALPGVTARVLLGFAVRCLVPLALVLFAFSRAAETWAPGPRVDLLLRGVTFASFVAALLYVTRRLRGPRRLAAPLSGAAPSIVASRELDPFL